MVAEVDLTLIERLETQAGQLDDGDQEALLRGDDRILDVTQVGNVRRLLHLLSSDFPIPQVFAQSGGGHLRSSRGVTAGFPKRRVARRASLREHDFNDVKKIRIART